ncbi:MAG: hypothetical protein PVG32_21355 [Anaerolineales bacterium]
MAEVALHAVVVIPAHSGGVRRVGAPLQPALGEVTALADVDGVGATNRPDGILTRHGHTGPK